MSRAVADQMEVFDDPSWRADLAMLAESSRTAARHYAADAFLLAELADRVPAPRGTHESALPWQSFVREVAVARGLQEQAAAREVDIARLLARHLPRTVERLSSGTVLLPRAVAFADELIGVDPQTAWAVDRALADRIPFMAPRRIRQEVRRTVDRLDADAAAERAARTAAGRAVRVSAERDGQASAYVNGPAVPMTRWFRALTETAEQLQAEGDPRSLDALRFDLVMGGFALDEPPLARTPHPESWAVTPAPAEASDADVPEALQPRAGLGPVAGTDGAAPVQDSATADATDRPRDGAAEPSEPCAAARREPEQLPLPGSEAPPDERWHPYVDNQPEPADPAQLLLRARAQVERILEAAHAAEAESLRRLAQTRAEHDRLAALVLRDRLLRSQETPSDRRACRPVQLLVHVPITTALGLSDEPGWLDGYGWISAPQVRQLLPVAELRQVCVTSTGQVVDLAPRVVRPEPTPTGVREALLRMATEEVALSAASWAEQPQHDPSPALVDLVRVRDRFCDGPLGTLVPAARADLDHAVAHPDGPTAAWNLAARARRSHRHKHAGWLPVRTGDGTLWTTPAGQVTVTPAHRHAPEPLAPDAVLPDPDELHRVESELLRPPL